MALIRSHIALNAPLVLIIATGLDEFLPIILPALTHLAKLMGSLWNTSAPLLPRRVLIARGNHARQSYCPICGQKTPTPRLTLHEIGMEVVHALAHCRSQRAVADLAATNSTGASWRGITLRASVNAYFGPFAFWS